MRETVNRCCLKIWLFAGKSEYPTVQLRPNGRIVKICSVQTISRKGQRVLDNHYIAGFVDGEGSFHVAFQKSADVRLGWQVIPEFHLNQNAENRRVLEEIQARLGCGVIKDNHRGRENDRTVVLVVRNRQDLHEKVIDFFDRYPLHTQKKHDFATFKTIVAMMMQDLHLTHEGFSEIVKQAYSMNAQGCRRKVPQERILYSLKSSETIRQKPANVG